MRISDWSSDVCSSDLTRDVTSIPSAGCFRNPAMPGVPPAPTGSLSGVAYFLESEFLQRIKALACCLGVRGFTRLLIHEALALGALQEGLGALCIAFLRSEEHTSELQSLMRISYAVFCLKKKQNHDQL